MTPIKPLLQVDNLKKHFSDEGSIFSRSRDKLKAVDGISFSIREGDIYGLVGESGCGKTTVARLILRLITPTSGSIRFDDKDLLSLEGEAQRAYRKYIQMIFQDPYSSLNPRWRVHRILEEPLDAHGIGTQIERKALIDGIIQKVGLPDDTLRRYPHEFSGGQRQRIGIARALVLNPRLIICDEPISALDVSIQAQIINLLKDLQEQYNLTYLLITHDLRVVNYLCDSVGVMYLGKIVEQADKKDVFTDPAHPYTQALFSAIPFPDPENISPRIILEGDVPSPLDPPKGCHFHTRCPKAMQRCREEEPPTVKLTDSHSCACFLYT